MAIRTVLVDDEEMALVNLQFALREYGYIEVIAQFTDALEAIEQIGLLQPDAVFLDIDMPGINGLEFAQVIRKEFSQVDIVFVTAYKQYALSAFDVKAIDYVLKPVSSKRLRNTVERLKEMGTCKKAESNRSTFQDINALVETIHETIVKKEWTSRKIPALKNDQIYLLDPSETLYITAAMGTVLIVTDRDSYLSRSTIKLLEEEYKNMGFFRCHKSFLINLNKVDIILPSFKGLYTVELKNCLENIPVSRNYVDEFRRILDL